VDVLEDLGFLSREGSKVQEGEGGEAGVEEGENLRGWEGGCGAQGKGGGGGELPGVVGVGRGCAERWGNVLRWGSVVAGFNNGCKRRSTSWVRGWKISGCWR